MSNSNGYVPASELIDTNGISLPTELEPLRERIAAHVHGTWGVGKMKAGFVYGEVTDNVAKTHTDLIPYDELTEEKKQYDRDTAAATLLALLALGYAITPPTT